MAWHQVLWKGLGVCDEGRICVEMGLHILFIYTRYKINTDPLWPRVILMVSSRYRVSSHPPGPNGPNGIWTSKGEFWTRTRQDVNLTFTRRLWVLEGEQSISTIIDPRSFPSCMNGFGDWKDTTLRTFPFFKSMDWLLRIILALSVDSIPHSSNLSCMIAV